MTIVFATAIITGILTAVICRFVGAFLRDAEWQENALLFGLLIAMLSTLAGFILFKSLGHASYLIMLAPAAVVGFFLGVAGAAFGVYLLFALMTKGVDTLANRGRELHNEYNFHRNLDRED